MQLFWPNAQCHSHGLNKLFLHLMCALCFCIIMISYLIFFHVYFSYISLPIQISYLEKNITESPMIQSYLNAWIICRNAMPFFQLVLKFFTASLILWRYDNWSYIIHETSVKSLMSLDLESGYQMHSWLLQWVYSAISVYIRWPDIHG